ncbi:MAG: PhoH family protein [Alphaproteobacteria bacterium]|nr:PhoH family protein [Alphaproteobacteria bacterium]
MPSSARPEGPIPEQEAAALTFPDNDRLREVVGEMGSHLKLIAERAGVLLTQRGNQILVSGDAEAVRDVRELLEQLDALVAAGNLLQKSDVAHAMRILADDPRADLASFFRDTILVGVEGRRITPRSAGQRAYVEALRTHDVVFGVGPAGTGKTYLAMAIAVAALKRGDVKRIILTRPAVEAGEKLGFLPGELKEKVDPYLRPLYDALSDMLPADRVARMIEKGVIEVAPLAFMRGRTLKSAVVLLDEAQNTTREQMRMFLTRLGTDSKMVITGDVTQTDLPSRRHSGMIHALEVLDGIDRIGVVKLSSRDVVRHPLVARIIDAYSRHDEEKER